MRSCFRLLGGVTIIELAVSINWSGYSNSGKWRYGHYSLIAVKCMVFDPTVRATDDAAFRALLACFAELVVG